MASTPKANAPTEKWIALLGRRDMPTDGVEDYCTFLSQALLHRGVELKKVRVQWNEKGWTAAIRKLWRESGDWCGNWVLLQYTALGWSRRGFPIPALIVLRVLRRRAARCVVVFHDASVSASPRLRDRMRNAVQNWTMRKLFEQSEREVLTVPLKSLYWLPSDRSRATFIPIGANVPEYCRNRAFSAEKTPKIVVVFSVTGGETQSQEVHDIALAARHVKQRVGPIRLEVFGRGCEEARKSLERALNGSGVELRVRGVVAAEEITRTLASAHALLCVRGLITSRRGTAIAGIACGLPVVGYGHSGSNPAIDAAGVRLVPWRNSAMLSDGLAQVLTDEKLWQDMHEKSLRAQAEYFSWDAVAGRFASMLQSRAVEP
jgi:glycosyltransferase involved in cell wall biosynthesis